MSDLSINELIAASIRTGLIPANVAAKAQGVTVSLDVASFAPESIGIAFTYGVRRMLQDHVNSKANETAKARDAAKAKGETFTGEFDAESCVSDRVNAFYTNGLSVRATSSAASAFTDLDLIAYDVACELKDAGKAFAPILAALKASHKAPTGERRRAVLDAIKGLPTPARDAILSESKARLERRQALAAMDLDLPLEGEDSEGDSEDNGNA